MDGVDFPRVRTTGRGAIPRGRFLIVIIFSVAALSNLHAQESRPAPKVTLDFVDDGPTSLFINETSEMKVIVKDPSSPADDGNALYTYAGGSSLPSNYTVAWTASMGSFLESYAPTTTFMSVSDIKGGGAGLVFRARAVKLPGEPTSAQSAPAAADPEPRLRGPVSAVPRNPSDLQKVLAQVNGMPDRDARLKRLREVVQQHPDDPLNIVLEFHIATMLGQNDDPEHNERIEPEQSLAMLRHILRQYDHKAYFSDHPMGETCSPDLMVPRAAILAASIYNGYLHDPKMARQYTTLAMEDLDWTFRKRTQDWANAPKPTQPDPAFGGPFEESKYAGRVAAWEKHKLDAAAGLAIGPYEKEVAAAAIRQFGLSYGPQHPSQVVAIMHKIIDDYPNSPLAVAAQMHIDLASTAATQPIQPGTDAIVIPTSNIPK